MAKMLKITNKRLVEIGEGLKTMAQRALPSLLAEQRVAIYFARLRPELEAYDKSVKPLRVREAAALRMPEGDPAREAELAAIELAMDEHNAKTIEIQAPRKKFVDADIPRALKTKDGSGLLNSSSAAMIRTLLQPEFFELEDPDKGLKEESDEPDDKDARADGPVADAREGGDAAAE